MVAAGHRILPYILVYVSYNEQEFAVKTSTVTSSPGDLGRATIVLLIAFFPPAWSLSGLLVPRPATNCVTRYSGLYLRCAHAALESHFFFFFLACVCYVRVSVTRGTILLIMLVHYRDAYSYSLFRDRGIDFRKI